MYNDMNDFKILEMSEMKKETKNSKKKKQNNPTPIITKLKKNDIFPKINNIKCNKNFNIDDFEF